MADAQTIEDVVIDSIRDDIDGVILRVENELGGSPFYTAARRALIDASDALKCARDSHT